MIESLRYKKFESTRSPFISSHLFNGREKPLYYIKSA